MLDATWHVHRTDGPTLVGVVVTNEAPVARRVAVAPDCEGAVMPPRRRGLPEEEWEDDRYAGVVPAEGHLAVGFATDADVGDPPGRVTDEGRADGPDGPATGSAPTPTALLRALGSPAPPRDAVPGVRGDESTPSPTTGSAEGLDDRAGPRVPAPVADWLDDVAARLERTAAGDGEGDGDGAGDGGAPGRTPEDRVDPAALRAVADRAARLAARCGPQRPTTDGSDPST